MKTGKITALVLSLVMAAGAAGCSSAPVSTVPGQETAGTSATLAASEKVTVATESSVRESGTGSYAENPVTEVKDRENGKLVIWSYNDDLRTLLDAYSPVKDYEYVVIPREEYNFRLGAALESGEAPDMFVCDGDSVRSYADTDRTLSINTIGITNKACSDMYDYTLRMACDSSGNIKGLAWEMAPSAVFYQKSVAQQYLGFSEPSQVSNSFSSWATFLTSARKISRDSDGNARIIAGTEELFKSYMSSRSTSWKIDGKLNVDSTAEAYLGFARTVSTEKLAFGYANGSDEWKAGMRNKTVLSYWGPLSLARSGDLALDPTAASKANPTSGDWGMVAAPGAYSSGGTWIMVSSSCDMRRSCADIMQAVCCDQGNLRDMLAGGKIDFVNSRTVINAAASDERYEFTWLGGQNPYAVLGPVAEKIDVGKTGGDDTVIENIFSRIVTVYSEGGIKTVNDAKAMFRELLIEKKIIKE
ncbi:MAG: extracellular solute-binding protein [Ruminococcaceae bacterium]|nr:extracellular solute-binding protein [Oscillospiraceae bacterium]